MKTDDHHREDSNGKKKRHKPPPKTCWLSLGLFRKQAQKRHWAENVRAMWCRAVKRGDIFHIYCRGGWLAHTWPPQESPFYGLHAILYVGLSCQMVVVFTPTALKHLPRGREENFSTVIVRCAETTVDSGVNFSFLWPQKLGPGYKRE